MLGLEDPSVAGSNDDPIFGTVCINPSLRSVFRKHH